MQKYIYIFFTIFVNTINLNLLISIIGIVLDDLQMKKEARDIQTQLDIFLSFNSNIYLVKRLIQSMFPNRFKNILVNRPKYIHYVSSEVHESDSLERTDENEGRVKMMVKRQDHIINEVGDLQDLIKQQQQNVEESISRIHKQMQRQENFVNQQISNIDAKLSQIAMNVEIKQLQDHLRTMSGESQS